MEKRRARTQGVQELDISANLVGAGLPFGVVFARPRYGDCGIKRFQVSFKGRGQDRLSLRLFFQPMPSLTGPCGT